MNKRQGNEDTPMGRHILRSLPQTIVGRYTCECMVPIININHSTQEPTHGYLKVRESLHTRVIIWVNIIILNHISIRTILTRYEGSYMMYSSNNIGNKQTILNIHTLMVSKPCNPCYRSRLIYLSIYMNDTRPTLIHIN